ncbi:TonB-dependent receptor [Echinicola rosea]|uniref:SusC/RagA family TonB-linked outer membrane protein n=1 Tax=Echinicola rosea TaxID=1807691 RepID=A0ABQ1UP68_9BACT|nr:TonB-dependent receptor [Echinicola rosea]GGF21750.1 SusC/RagA family TonB-linked outer membrane protein [Echinicola rosea]
MKLTLILVMVGVMKVSASAYSQNVKLKLDLHQASIEQVFEEIKNQSEFSFLYRSDLIKEIPKVDINLNKASLEKVLDQLLIPYSFVYEIHNKTVIIRKKERTKKDEENLQQKIDLIDVTGTVTDENGQPIPGATVQVQGTTRGSVTDIDGKYSIEVEEGAVLIFSFIGYQQQMVEVGNQTVLNISLSPDMKSLDEVVVVGYGTQKKVNVIGSVSQISSESIENRPVPNATQALAGQMPGVTVIQRSGRPGESSGSIRVRGVGSFGATPDALVIIDGIPGTLDDINPNDIKSVSVLKDASSAAIYGARAANGVILVTTKSGSESKLTVSYNGYVGFNEATELPDLVNSWEYAEMYNIASGSNSYTEEDIEKYRNQSDPDNYPNTRFLDELFSRKGVQTGHTISLNGGGDIHKYFLSAGYLGQQGIIEKNNYNRYNIRLNLESDLAENLTMTTRLFGTYEERNEPQATANKGGELSDQLIQNSLRYPAVYLGQASNGDFGIGPESGGTPVSWLQSASYLKNPESRMGVNIRLAWEPIKGLVLTGIGGYNFTLLEERSYLASQRLNDEVYLAQSYLNQYSNKEVYKTTQFLAEYTKEINNNPLDLLVGYSFENQILSYFNGYRQDFPSNDYTVLGMGGADNQLSGGYDDEWAIQSLFSRVRYNHDEKYLVEATVRYDGSSRFPESNKYALFPSMALGWRLSEENFFQNVNWVSDLKLKASWGVLGNQNIGNYPYQRVLQSGRNYPIGGGIATGAAYSTYKDADIKWESTTTTDVGFEAGFLEGKLTLNATYFNRATTDILFQPSASVSTVLGVSMSETNTGEAKNSGFEFDLGYRNSSGDFEYSFAGNFSLINNEVVTLGLGNVEQPNGFVGNGSNLFIGYPMEMYYGYQSDGVFLNPEDIGDWADQTAVNPNPQEGDIRYMDISGPDGVPDGQVDPTYDRTYLGSRIPKYTFGFSFGLKYKSFDFSALMQGAAGVKGLLNNYAGWAFYNLGNIQRWQMEGRFDPDNPQRYPDYPRLEVITNSGTPNTVLSDFWVMNAAYLRVKNLQLGYTLPEAAVERIGLQNARLYLSGENLLSFNSYRQGWDPEINTSGAYYPVLATYTLGVNIKF